MPELPEVETVVKDLRPPLVGAHFVSIETNHANAIVLEKYDFDDLRGREVLDVRKFGKVWLNKLDDYRQVTGIWRLGAEPFDMVAEDFVMTMSGRKGVLWKMSEVEKYGGIFPGKDC